MDKTIENWDQAIVRKVRAPITPTHPHGQVIVRADNKAGLVRISKCASSELVDRMDCRVWQPFDLYLGPTAAFFRNPFKRFLSSVPETMLRVSYLEIADYADADRVIVPEDVYHELSSLAVSANSIESFLEGFVELVEYQFFDAHHEPQLNFLVDRHGYPRIDPHLYLVEKLEQGLENFAALSGIQLVATADARNVGGQKPQRGSTVLRDWARRLTGTGLYRPFLFPGPLGARYGVADIRGRAQKKVLRKDLNMLANQFSKEFKSAAVDPKLKQRITRLYEIDDSLWQRIDSNGIGSKLSELN